VTRGFDAGWRARVDGLEVPVLRVNKAFRGVPLPAGTHEIEMVYRPPAVGWGLLVSGMSIGMTVLLALVGGQSRRRGTAPPTEDE
jgi:uncharacterized membrane protein YfhO